MFLVPEPQICCHSEGEHTRPGTRRDVLPQTKKYNKKTQQPLPLRAPITLTITAVHRALTVLATEDPLSLCQQ